MSVSPDFFVSILSAVRILSRIFEKLLSVVCLSVCLSGRDIAARTFDVRVRRRLIRTGSKFLMNRADMNHLIITVYAYANEDDFYATDYYLLNMIEIYFS